MTNYILTTDLSIYNLDGKERTLGRTLKNSFQNGRNAIMSLFGRATNTNRR